MSDVAGKAIWITGASSGAIDWKSIISLAEDLHKKEQRLLQKISKENLPNVKTPN